MSILHHIASATGGLPVTRDEHGSLVHSTVLTAAWTEVLLPLCALGLLGWVVVRRRRRN